MSTKHIQILVTVWFISTLICLVLEGTYFGTSERGILNHLVLIIWYPIGPFQIPVFNPLFLQGIYELMTFGYSFYTGQYEVLRWFWAGIFNAGAIWGIVTNFIPIISQIIASFRSILTWFTTGA